MTAPIVVRLDGTNATEGRALLAEAARPEITVEETMLAMQKANLGFQATLQVRNRLLQAYTDIMNMQV